MIPMTLATILPYAEVIFAALMILGIVLQRSEASLGSAFGGADLGSSYHTRRGPEKFLFIFSIVVSILFVVTTVLTLMY